MTISGSNWALDRVTEENRRPKDIGVIHGIMTRNVSRLSIIIIIKKWRGRR